MFEDDELLEEEDTRPMKGKIIMSEEEGLSRLGVDLPRSLHQQVKVLAAARGERIQDLVLRAVRAELARLARLERVRK